MRKTLVGLLALVALAAFLALPAVAHPGAPTFEDVPDNYRPTDNPPGDSHDAVEWGEATGVSQGGFDDDNDGTFESWNPTYKIQRQAVMRWLFNYDKDVVQPALQEAEEELGSYVDGPYPGDATSLQDLTDDGRAEYGTKWTDAGLNKSVVRCADGYVATGGGFRGEPVAKPALNIVASYPAGIGGDGEVVTEGGGYIGSEFDSDNAANSTVGQNGWVVEGYYGGTGETIVRPYVVCAAVE